MENRGGSAGIGFGGFGSMLLMFAAPNSRSPPEIRPFAAFYFTSQSLPRHASPWSPPSPPKSRSFLPVHPLQRAVAPCHTTHHAHHALPTLFLSPLPAVAGLCFHHFPNPFFCNPFIFTSLQIPRVWGVCAHLSELCVSVPLWQIHLFQELAASLRLFALFFESSPFVFNRLQPLFAKHPGGGVFRRSHARPPYPERVHATSPG